MRLRPLALRSVLCALLLACGREESVKASAAPANPDPTQNTYAPALGVALPAFYKTQRGTYYQDVSVGTGTVAIPGRKAKVRYTGWLPDGKQFDSGDYEFTPGAGEVIEGWDDGVVGMKVGGKRKLVIPASLGYGERGAPPDIPPNSVLVFEVELLGVQ
jgi:FKBP-type peptidyl-prolyl cis-trans isomerase